LARVRRRDARQVGGGASDAAADLPVSELSGADRHRKDPCQTVVRRSGWFDRGGLIGAFPS
jgi:hypothetical protein